MQRTHSISVDDRPKALQAPIYRLRIAEPDKEQRLVELEGSRIRVGSRPENDLVLEDKAVSRIHFELSLDEKGCRLKDLDSTNGVHVNGIRCSDVILPEKATIHCGQTTIEYTEVRAATEIPLSAKDRFGPMLGQSTRMRELFAALEKVAPSDFTILVEGETGTGKELVAEAVHQASKRAGGPLVVFDCSAVAPNLLESMLFGHEKGSFTGAHDRHIGCLEEADGGTLFLDELGELPLDLQSKLLRALEKGEFRRVGGSKTLHTDARVLAATNRDLAREVNKGAFRADLYYRIAVVRVVVPALRERKDDLELLIRHFATACQGGDRGKGEDFVSGLSESDWKELRRHTWPGNVRELRNVVFRRVAMGSGLVDDLYAAGTEPSTEAVYADEVLPGGAEDSLRVSFAVDLDQGFLDQKKALLAQFERKYLSAQLERHGGVVTKAAKTSGIDRMYYHRMLKKNQ